MNKDVQLAITQQLQGIKLRPNGAAELYPRMKHGTQSTLPYNPLIPHALTQQDTHTHTQTETADIPIPPLPHSSPSQPHPTSSHPTLTLPHPNPTHPILPPHNPHPTLTPPHPIPFPPHPIPSHLHPNPPQPHPTLPHPIPILPHPTPSPSHPIPTLPHHIPSHPHPIPTPPHPHPNPSHPNPNPLILQTLTQQGTHTHTQTEATEIEAAPQHGEARSRTNEQQAERKSRRTLKRHDGEATDDDLKTGKIMMAKESHSSIAAAGYTAAGNNQSKWYNAKEEYRKARRSAWRTHEEGTERYRRDGHTAANTCSSEPHMAAHTTRAAHPMKGVETYMCVDEDGERRQRTKRENNIDATAPGVAQPRASIGIEPSDAASGSHSSRETIGILAEAKSRFIQKGNFHDIGIEKKRERDPG